MSLLIKTVLVVAVAVALLVPTTRAVIFDYLLKGVCCISGAVLGMLLLTGSRRR